MVKEFLKKIDCEPKIILDLGARDCKQSIELSEAFPGATVYAFECNPNTIPLCRENIKSYKNIILIEKAVTSYDGFITFYPINQKETKTSWKDGNPGASSVFKSNGTYEYETYVQYETVVSCCRLDSIITEKVDLIWMDLQGSELNAMIGLGDKLRNVDYIHTEVSHKPIYLGQCMFPELNTFLTQNFKLINNLTYQGWQEDAIYKNVEL